jgi:N,N'-diacetyllegionaminate synthase
VIIEILNNGSFNKWDNFYEKNLKVKRPDIGLSSMKWNKIIGKKAKKNYKKDDFIK